MPIELWQLRRRGIGRVHRNLEVRLGYGRDWFSFARDALQAGPKNAPLTRDIGGTAGTVDLGKAIAEVIAR